MDKQLLQELVEQSFSLSEIVERTGKCRASVCYWLKKYGLKTKIARYNKGGEANKTKGWRKPACYCPKCGETDPKRFYERKGRLTKYIRCKTCHTEEQKARVRSYKQRAVEYKGGKCVKCGYDKCLASLDFHHEDPTQKDPNWRKMRSWKFEKIKDELDKCILVCRNCHGEIHYDD